MEDRTAIFESYPVPKAMMIMAVPSIVSQLITLVYNLADTWFIGRTNNPYMVAACSLVLPAYMLALALSNIFGVGGGTLVSRLLGVKNEEEAKKVGVSSLWMALALALAYCLICLALRDPFLKLLGASEKTLPYARQYMLYVLIIGGAFMMLSATMSAMIRSIGYSAKASTGLAIGGLLNIALDPLFMFVLLPDGRQVVGAALATMVSNIVSFAYFLVVYIRMRDKTILSFDRSVGRPTRESYKAIFSVGLPAAFTMILFDLTNIFINRLCAAHGDIQLAAIGIVLKAERLPLNITIGLCIGMVPMLAYSYSARNYKRMDSIFNFSRLAGLAFAVVCVVLYRIFARDIMHLFINDALTVEYGTQFLKARCFATPMMFLCFSLVHYMQALGKGKELFLLPVIRQLVFNIPILLIMEHFFGVIGIVWTQLIADCCTVVVSYIIYFRLRRREGLNTARAG